MISWPSPSSAGRNGSGWRGFSICEDGIPSHDRFNAILAAIKPAEFEKCLLSWITALHEITDGQVVAIDGKTLRRSFDAASGKSAIHMVSAWATANQISLGQVVVDEKSNEITAIPKLLEMLEISGCLVTIDAMGCQTEIARKIVDGGGGLRAGREGKPADAARRDRGVLRRSLGRRLRAHEGASPSRRRKKDTGGKRNAITRSVRCRTTCPTARAGRS